MKTYWNCIRHHYADFSGRAPIKEFWLCWIGFVLVSIIWAAFLLAAMYATSYPVDARYSPDLFNVTAPIHIFLSVLMLAFGVFSYIPVLAVTVRRLHDTGMSGWLLLVVFIIEILPEVFTAFFGQDFTFFNLLYGLSQLLNVILGVFIFVLLCLDSKQGTNAYGPNPKELAESQQGTSTNPATLEHSGSALHNQPSTICGACGYSNPEHSQFCGNCSSPLATTQPPAPILFCSTCGTRILDKTIFCNNCGTPLRH